MVIVDNRYKYMLICTQLSISTSILSGRVGMPRNRSGKPNRAGLLFSVWVAGMGL